MSTLSWISPESITNKYFIDNIIHTNTSEYYTEAKKYFNYIQDHVTNVAKAYDKYGKDIIYSLNLHDKESKILETLIIYHDKSKITKEEFEGYRQWFYPADNEIKVKSIFDAAWFHHIKENPHHPEHWTYLDDNRKAIIMDMPKVYIAEMILDWASFNFKSNDDKNIIDFWEKNKDKKPLSENTKDKVEIVINEVFR